MSFAFGKQQENNKIDQQLQKKAALSFTQILDLDQTFYEQTPNQLYYMTEKYNQFINWCQECYKEDQEQKLLEIQLILQQRYNNLKVQIEQIPFKGSVKSKIEIAFHSCATKIREKLLIIQQQNEAKIEAQETQKFKNTTEKYDSSNKMTDQQVQKLFTTDIKRFQLKKEELFNKQKDKIKNKNKLEDRLKQKKQLK